MTPNFRSRHDNIRILMADDDEEDCELMKEAIGEQNFASDISFVHDGESLVNRLRAAAPEDYPDLVLLDLNMPRMDGLEALKIIRSDERLRRIPVVIFSTSSAEEDVKRCYDAGGNSYISKPSSFSGLVEVARNLLEYWFEVVWLPGPQH